MTAVIRRGPPPLALRRVCGVCRHFDGPSMAGRGACLKHGGDVIGNASPPPDCSFWGRRVAGVDPVPFRAAGTSLPAEHVPGGGVAAAEAPDPVPATPVRPAQPKVTAIKALRPASAPSSAPRGRPSNAVERQKRIPALMAQGLAAPAMAKVLKVNVNTIYADVAALGLKLPQRLPPHPGPSPERLAMIERIRALVAEGMSGPTISAALGIGLRHVYRLCSAGSIRITSGGLRGGASRRPEVEALVRQGLSQRDIRRATGLSKAAVSAHVADIGIAVPKAVRAPKSRPAASVEQRREAVRALVACGVTYARIAEVLGVSETTVDTDLRAIKAARA